MMTIEIEASAAGRRAFMQGFTFKANPHPDTSSVARAWARGWYGAHREQAEACLPKFLTAYADSFAA